MSQTGLMPKITGGLSSAWNWISGAGKNPASQTNEQARQGLLGNAADARGFAGTTQANYDLGTDALRGQLSYLQQLQRGQNSVSAEQLRQALSQNQAAQQSMAAGAAPQNAAMAARTAAIQMGRQGSALAGQQAVAGLQERNNAAQQLDTLGLGMRGQDLQGTLGGYNAANGAYGSMINPQGDQSKLQQLAGPLSAIAGAFAASDRNLKTAIEDGDGKAEKLLEGLKGYSYKYKDPDKHGQGEQLGVMAQDLEKVVPDAVINTPSGKMVNGAKLAGALAATLPVLNRKISELERRAERADNDNKSETPILAVLRGGKGAR